jgi:hypothetical protein
MKKKTCDKVWGILAETCAESGEKKEELVTLWLAVSFGWGNMPFNY